jgi:uncharacterized phage-associated protein
MKPKDPLFIAQCLLKIADTDENYDMTNMKLQKLLYYAQGTCIALHNQPLFNADIRKWQYGPVVPEVYYHYRENGRNIINPPEEIELRDLSPEQLEVIRDVYNFFGQFSAVKLMHLTHSELPWETTEMNEIITNDKLIEFFNQIVIKE